MTPAPKTVPCQYKTGKILGHGTYAVVKECVHIETGKYYACKVISKNLMRGREALVRNEIAILQKVSQGHPNILTLWDHFETLNNLYLVTDLALGGELFDRICAKGSYYEFDAAHLVCVITKAVEYLHHQGIVHRDLKPENVIFRTKEEDADLLIADFGLSRIVDEEKFNVLTTTAGTPGYMAPEVLRKQGHGTPVDIWAIGVITFFLLAGYTPFDRESQVEEFEAICRADVRFEPKPYWEQISASAKDFIQQCLMVDVKKRLTAKRALEHEWLRAAAEKVEKASRSPIKDDDKGANLLPNVRQAFDAKKSFRKGVNAVKWINAMKQAASNERDGEGEGEHGGGDHEHQTRMARVREIQEERDRSAEEEAHQVLHIDR